MNEVTLMDDDRRVRRVAHRTADVGVLLGRSDESVRREAERKSVLDDAGVLTAELPLGIRAQKFGGRWVYRVPAVLLEDATR